MGRSLSRTSTHLVMRVGMPTWAGGGAVLVVRTAFLASIFGTGTAWCGETGGGVQHFSDGDCYDCGTASAGVTVVTGPQSDCYSCNSLGGDYFPYYCASNNQCSNTPCPGQSYPPPVAPPATEGTVACMCCSGKSTDQWRGRDHLHPALHRLRHDQAGVRLEVRQPVQRLRSGAIQPRSFRWRVGVSGPGPGQARSPSPAVLRARRRGLQRQDAEM